MNFWKIFGASIASVLIGIVLCFVVIFFSIGTLISSFKVDGQKMPESVILYIDLGEKVIDSPNVSMFSDIDITNMTMESPITILQLISTIDAAAFDPNVKALCIRQDGWGEISTANIEELRRAIENFKLSGKSVIAYDEIYTQSEYYLASVADFIIMHPEGSLDWHGVAFTPVFFKGLLDKVDAEVETFRPKSCRYKSGVEPFIMTRMSEDNRKQMTALANSIWSSIVDDVALSRGIDRDNLKTAAQNLLVCSAEDALNLGLIDLVGYEDSLYDIYETLGIERNEQGEFNTLSVGEYIDIGQSQLLASIFNNGIGEIAQNTGAPMVAIIYADGEIVDGNMLMDGYVFSSSMAAELRQARLDERTKAVVVRVNSPGGSAIASDVIWREMQLLQQTKPLVVSMGEYAASGGYYLSVPADYIFANRTTLTGSIGVFGLNINLEKSLKNLLGITFDMAATSPSAGGISPVRAMTSAERQMVERGVERTYNTFVEHVAEGRNISKDGVLDVAEGRVWSGEDAYNIGLVDAIGGLSEAIYMAAELADVVDNFTIYEFTPPMGSLEQWAELMSSLFLTSINADVPNLDKEVKELFMNYPYLYTYQGIKAMMPARISINL